MEATETATITYTQTQMVAYFESRMRFAQEHLNNCATGSEDTARWEAAYGAYYLGKCDVVSNSIAFIPTIY